MRCRGVSSARRRSRRRETTCFFVSFCFVLLVLCVVAATDRCLGGRAARSGSRARQVPWVKHGSDVFRTTLALSLQPSIFGPAELIPDANLHVVLRGVVIKDTRIITRGQVWGTDVIIQARRAARDRAVLGGISTFWALPGTPRRNASPDERVAP
jgi:hypothetical protein